jgi:hypothetical protein
VICFRSFLSSRLPKAAEPPLHGKRVHLSIERDVPAVSAALQRRGATITGDRLQASAFIVDDLSANNMRARWMAALTGGCLVSKAFVLHGFGPFIVYKTAVAYPRCLFMTDAFKAAHPELSQVVAVACRRPSAKWRVLASRDIFLQQQQRNRSGPQSITALVTKAELEAGWGSCRLATS